MTLQIFTCARCNHCWASRTTPRPRWCARCKAAFWWRPARIPKAATQESGPLGRPEKFPQLNTLEIGECLLLPWREKRIERWPFLQPDRRYNASINRNVMAHARRTGHEYHTFGTAVGLEVRRVG